MSPQTAEYNSFTKCDSKSAECIQCVLLQQVAGATKLHGVHSC